MFTYRPRIQANRLNDAEVSCARNQRLKEIHMWSIIREALVYLCFLLLLCFVTYPNRDQNSSLQVTHLRKYFFQPDYSKVCSFLLLFFPLKTTNIFIDFHHR